MARVRARTTYCPACDARLDPSLAEQSAPACPACDTSLLGLRVAGWWRRSFAGAVDGIILLLTAGLLNWGLLALSDAEPLLGNARGLAVLLALLDLDVAIVLRRFAPLLSMSALYLVLFWALTGRTPGGRLLKIRVVAANGRPPGLFRTLLRVATHFFGLALGALGWVWAALDPHKQAWHDHFASTFVVRDM